MIPVIFCGNLKRHGEHDIPGDEGWAVARCYGRSFWQVLFRSKEV